VGFGFDTQLLGLSTTPFVTVHYGYLDEESFTENGAGDLGLRVGSRGTDSLIGELGLRTRSRLGPFAPEFTLAWRQDFAIDDSALNAAFLGAPDARLNLDGRRVERGALRAGLDLRLAGDGPLQLSLQLDTLLRRKAMQQSASLNLGYSF